MATEAVEQRFAQRMRQLRQRAGMSQAEMARRLSEHPGIMLDDSAITRIEKNAQGSDGARVLRLSEACAIADVLGVDLADMIGRAPLPDGRTMSDQDVQAQILATLKSIDDKLTPAKPKLGYQVKLGRTFTAGQTIPEDVDLVMGAGGVRWAREFEHTPAGALPTDQWYPRDGEGPVLATAELLAQAGHVTEIPAPAEEGP